MAERSPKEQYPVSDKPKSATYSDPLAEQVCYRFAQAEHKKSRLASIFEDCYRFTLPGKTSQIPEENVEIFDETGVVALQEFASQLQDGLLPPFSRFADLEAGTDVPSDEAEEVNKLAEIVTEYIFSVLNGSNMNQEIAETFLDLGISTGCLKIEESMEPGRPINFRAISLNSLYIDEGVDGRVGFIAIPVRIHASMIRLRYPRAKMTHELMEMAADPKSQPVYLIEASWRDYDSPVEKWITAVVVKSEKHLLFQDETSGEGSCPFVVFRWSKDAGEVWGRGPVMNVLPAIKTANKVVEIILENAELNMVGVYTIEDDGVVNVDTIQIMPGTVIPIAQGSQMRNVQGGGNVNMSQLVLNEMRMNIRKGLYNDMLGNPDKTPMSATEVSARMAHLARQVGSAFGRLQTELVEPLIRRVIFILKQKKEIELPQVNGRDLRLVTKSPLAQAQSHKDVTNIAQYVQMVGQLFGPQVVNLLINTEEAARHAATLLRVPPKILRTTAEKKQMMQMVAQAASQMQGQPSGEQPPQAGAEPNVQEPPQIPSPGT